MKLSKKWVIAALTLAYLAGIIWLVDLKDVYALLSKISVISLAAVTALAILANIFALVRSRSTIQAFDLIPSWRDTFLAFAAGNLATLAFNVFGQSISRAVILQNAGIPFGITVLATYIERLLAAGILFLLSLIAAWILFRGIQVDFSQGAGDLLFSAFGIIIVAIAVALFVLRASAIQGSLAALRLSTRLGPSAFWTILGFGAGLAAYLVLFDTLDHAAISWRLVAALTIVMLATSLPISFAGFGLRELSAAVTLKFVGIDPAVAIAASILVGVIYIGVAGLFGLAALPLATAPDAKEQRPVPAPAAGRRTLSDSLIIQSLAVTTAILMFFRVRVPVSDRDVLININAADTVVFIAFTVIALMILAGRTRALFPSSLWTSLLILTSSITVGIITAFAYGHLGGWAIYTRGWGWVVILGYVSLGVATMKVAGEVGSEKVAGALIAAGVTICILQLVGLTISFFYPPASEVFFVPLQGFARNQNAFAFDLAICGVLLIAAKNWGPLRDRRTAFACMLATLSVTMFLTESRTAIVFVIILALLDLSSYFYFRSKSPIPLPTATFAIVATFLTISLFAPVSSTTANHRPTPIENIQTSTKPTAEVKTTRLDHPHADAERLGTIVGGLSSWKEKPVFGVGIGRFFESSKLVDATPKSIHSVYVWFLSEMGLFGLFALLASAGLMSYSAWTMMTTHDARWGFTALGCLVIIGIGGVVQDFTYQRVFWFVMGLSLTTKLPTNGSLLKDRILVGAVASLATILLIVWHWPR